ncbi:MAG TPA: serine hydrolase [Vicinamibacteria bacterium]|nr:serine hydrolase [Vicinamibacteria bacterium]
MLAALLLSLALNEPQALLRERFEREVREIAARVDGVLGVTVLDPETGDRISVNGGVVFTQASAIKLPVLVELMRQVDAGEQNLDEIVTMKASDVVPGSGVLQQLTPGSVSMTLRDVATLMVTVSDNTATNMIIDRVGMPKVNAEMARLGVPSTKLQRKMQDRKAWEENRENLSTPDEQARLLELLYKGEVLSAKSREEIDRILSIPKPGQLRTLLPEGTKVAHKTGTLEGVVVDVGIVYLEDRPFIVSAMGNWLADADEAERAIAEIALAAYRYFDRIAHSNAYGHKR